MKCPSCDRNDRIIGMGSTLPLSGERAADGEWQFVNGWFGRIDKVFLTMFPFHDGRPVSTEQYELEPLGIACAVGHEFYAVTDRSVCKSC